MSYDLLLFGLLTTTSTKAAENIPRIIKNVAIPWFDIMKTPANNPKTNAAKFKRPYESILARSEIKDTTGKIDNKIRIAINIV